MSNSVEIRNLANPRDKNNQPRPILIGAARCQYLKNYPTKSTSNLSISADPAHQLSIAASVEAYLHKLNKPRKSLFHFLHMFFAFSVKSLKINDLRLWQSHQPCGYLSNAMRSPPVCVTAGVTKLRLYLWFA
jgi:hypothetical protein